MNNEHFPWVSEKSPKTKPAERKLADEVLGLEIIKLLTSFSLLGITGLLVDRNNLHPDHPDHSSFLHCNCNEKMGIIWTEIGFSTIIGNESEAETLLGALSKLGQLDEFEIVKIKRQVEIFFTT